MLILALDLSGQVQSAALVRDGAPLVEHTWPAPRFAAGGPAGGPLAVVGDICAAAGRGLVVVPPVYAWPRAAFVAALAEVRWADPEFDRSGSLQPQYLRRPGITRSSRSRGLAAAGLPGRAT